MPKTKKVFRIEAMANGQLVKLSDFYARDCSHFVYKPLYFKRAKKRKQKQLKLSDFYARDCSHFGFRPWYIRRALDHLLYVYDTMDTNNIMLLKDPLQETIFEYVAVDNFHEKIVKSQFVNDKDDMINYADTSVEYTNTGTPQKANIHKLVFGYIRLQMEDVYMPYYLAMIVVSFYGNIIMVSDILNVNHMNIIKYTLNQLKPTLINIKFRKTHKFHDVRHTNNIFMVILKTNTNDIMGFYNSPKISFSMLLNSSIPSIPVRYKMHNFNIYHFPNNFELDFNQKLADIFIELNNSNCDLKKGIKGIGSVSKHNLVNANESHIVCSQCEVFELE